RISSTLLGAATDRDARRQLLHGRLTQERQAPGFEALAGASIGQAAGRSSDGPRVPRTRAADEHRSQKAFAARARAEELAATARALEEQATVRERQASEATRAVTELQHQLRQAEARARERRQAAREAAIAAKRARRAAAALAWMATLGCLELHPHPVRAEDLEHPDELRIDLDPVPGVVWSQLQDVARVVRDVLADFGLVGWPKTSGSRGIHVYARIHRQWSFTEMRRAALAVAREVERRAPTLATSKWWKEERHGVFLDYNQNAKDRTVAGAYSVRPTPDARVSAPV